MPIPTSDGALYWATGIDNSGLKRDAAQSEGIIKGLGSRVSRLDVFAGLAAAGTAAFIKISKASFQLSKDLDLAMREVQTISKAAQDNFEGMKDAVVDLSTDVPDSARDLSKALYQIVSAGYDGAEGLKLLEVSTKAAVGGVTDTMTAADGLTSVMNAWKISAQDATKVSDIFFTTVERGKTKIGEMASSIAKVAPLAAAYKISFEEIAAATATLTKQGTPTAEAMTQIRQAIIAANKILGEGWSETMTFQEALVEVRKRAEESGKGLKEFVGEVEGVSAVLGLTGKNIEMATGDLEAMKNSLGASTKAFDVMRMAAENQIKILRNQWHDKLLGFGDSLIKMFGRVATSINTHQTIKDLSEQGAQVRALTSELIDANTEEGRRKEILADLQKISPDIVEGISSENIEIGKLQGNLEKYNTTLAQRIALESLSRDEQKQAADEAKKLLDRGYIETAIREQIVQSGIDMAKLQNKSLKEQIEITKGYLTELTEAQRPEFTYTETGQKIEKAKPAEETLNYIISLSNNLDKASDKLDEAETKGESIRARMEEMRKILLGESGTGGIDYGDGGGGGGSKVFDFEIFQDQIQEAKKAYDEWNRYRKTSLADELKVEYDQYLEHGEDYEDYLNDMLKAFEDNAQARILIMKQLAEIEAQYLEATENAMQEFYKGWGDEIERSFKNNIDKVKASHDQWIDSLDKAVQTSLKNEKTADEAAKAYVRFGKVVYLTTEELQELENKTREYVKTLDELGWTLQNFGAEGDESIRAIGDGIQAVVSILNGDYISGIYRLVDSLDRLMQGWRRSKAELSGYEEGSHVAHLNSEIEKLNQLLDEHIELLDTLSGTDWLAATRSSADLIRKDIDEINKKIREEPIQWKPRDEWGFEPSKEFMDQWYKDWIDLTYNIAKLTNDQIKTLLLNYKDILLPGTFNQFMEWFGNIDEAEQALADFTNKIKAELTGTTFDCLVDSIADGFLEGKRNIEDFADTFEELMKKAIIETFKRQILASLLLDWYNQFAAFLQNESPGGEKWDRLVGKLGELTEFEMNYLEKMLEKSFEAISPMMDVLAEKYPDWFGTEIKDPNSLSGAIRRELTEETGSLLAGKMNMLIMDVRDMKLIQHAAADTLLKIEQNTSYNRFLTRLERMDFNLDALKNQLLG